MENEKNIIKVIEFNYGYADIKVTVVAYEDHSYRMYSEDVDCASRLWNINDMLMSNMVANGLQPETENGKIKLEEKHFFNGPNYKYSTAFGRYEFIDELVYD